MNWLEEQLCPALHWFVVCVCVRASVCVRVVLQCRDYITAAPWKSSLSIEGVDLPQLTDRSPCAYSLRLIWEVSVIRLESRWWFRGAGHALAKSCSAKKTPTNSLLPVRTVLKRRGNTPLFGSSLDQDVSCENIQIGEPSCSVETDQRPRWQKINQLEIEQNVSAEHRWVKSIISAWSGFHCLCLCVLYKCQILLTECLLASRVKKQPNPSLYMVVYCIYSPVIAIGSLYVGKKTGMIIMWRRDGIK